MTVLLVVIGALFVGAFFLLRSDPPAAAAGPAPDVDTAALKKTLLAALAEASPEWTWEEVPGEPLVLSGRSSASGEARRLELSDLANAWGRLVAAERNDAAERTIDAFVMAVVGATAGEGDGTGEVAAGGEEWALQALALRLGTGTISTTVHGLTFELVVRQPTGAAPVTEADLGEWKLDRHAALKRAIENLDDSVKDGLPHDVLSGDRDAPDAAVVLPEDPLAPALVAAPGFKGWLVKKFGDAARAFVTTDGKLVVTRDGKAPAGITVAHGPLAA